MESLQCKAVLFDLDGVLVNSDRAIRMSWRDWAAQHGLSLENVLAHAYGRRSRDTIALSAPHLDADTETTRLTAIELAYMSTNEPFPNAQNLLVQLAGHPHAVVTSGTFDLASARLRQCDLPMPDVFVTAQDVRNGKPDPEGYLLAAARLGTLPGACVVVEDAPAGLQAAKAAGMQAIGVATTHDPADLSLADLIVPALDRLGLTVHDDTLTFALTHPQASDDA